MKNVIGGSLAGITFEDSENDFHPESTWRMLGNYVGVDATGVAVLPNMAGVLVESIDSNVSVYIGSNGEDIYSKNVISGNIGANLVIAAFDNSMNLDASGVVEVLGNYIGPNANGEQLTPISFPVGYLLEDVIAYITAGAIEQEEEEGEDEGEEEGETDIDEWVISWMNEFNETVKIPDLDLYLGVGVVIMELVDVFDTITIGGDTEDDRNVISGNGFSGIFILSSNNDHHNEEAGEGEVPDPSIQIKGNYIGLAPDGVTPLPNKIFDLGDIGQTLNTFVEDILNFGDRMVDDFLSLPEIEENYTAEQISAIRDSADVGLAEIGELINLVQDLLIDTLEPINGSGIAVVNTSFGLYEQIGEDEYQLVGDDYSTSTEGIEITDNYIAGNEGSGLVLYNMRADMDPLMDALEDIAETIVDLMVEIGFEDYTDMIEGFGYYSVRIEGGVQRWEGESIRGNFFGVDASRDQNEMPNGTRGGGFASVNLVNIFDNTGVPEDDMTGIVFNDSFPLVDNVIHGGMHVNMLDDGFGGRTWFWPVEINGGQFAAGFSENTWDGPLWYDMYQGVLYLSDTALNNPNMEDDDYVPPTCYWDGAEIICEWCGNRVVEEGEGCDDGNRTAGDGCSARCQVEVCGNGIIENNEECDDGNVIAGDGCSSTCETEGGGTVIITTPSCPSGMYEDSNGDCVSDDCPDGVNCNDDDEEDLLCNRPFIAYGEICICPDGYQREGSTCVHTSCENNARWDYNQCVPLNCEVGYVAKSHECVPIVCDAGYSLHGNRCVKDVIPCTGPNCGQTKSLGLKKVESSIAEVEDEEEDMDECKVDSDCPIDNECKFGPDGYLICVEKDDLGCANSSGIIDENYNDIPDCLEDRPYSSSDEFVFGLTGEEPLLPAIVNLDGKIVDQNPLILVTYKADTNVLIKMKNLDTGNEMILIDQDVSDVVTGQKNTIKIITEGEEGKYTEDQSVIGKVEVDVEYKGQYSVNTPIPIGKYEAVPVGSDGVSGNPVTFEVAKTDMEIVDLKVQEDDVAPISRVQPLAKEVLSAIEESDNSGRFVADEYIDYRRKKLIVERQYKIYAKINSKDKNKKIAYFTYKSVLYSSVALTDISSGAGEYITVPVPKNIAKNEPHILTMYVTDLDRTKISSMKSIRFTME